MRRALPTQCPRCGSTRVNHQGPGPGEGGLYHFHCHDCGHEEGGIADPGGPRPGLGEPAAPRPADDEVCKAKKLPRDQGRAIAGRCSVCGKPGTVQNLPGGVPASDCFCEEHEPAFVLKPLSCLFFLLVTGLAALLAFWWLAS